MTGVGLEVRRAFDGTVGSASSERVLVTFPGSTAVQAQLAEVGGTDIHLRFEIGSRLGPPNAAVLVFVDQPGATPTTPGPAGSVAFFAHDGHVGHGSTPFRLALTAALAGRSPAGPVSVTFVPVGYPGRSTITPTLDVVATLLLVKSTVDI